ncbi:MAG: DUF2244 domain-containing protein [Gammaproteobacteria bacterium]|nr:DUF2244 domain-containing protein [Gammaproteobacteria bacterium]
MPWNTLLRIFAGMALFTLMIGIGCAALGLPLVLPFSGLEVLALAAGLYLSAVRGSVREIVRIDNVAVVYEAGIRAPERRERFHRQWAQVALEQVRNGWYPSRLLLRCHGRQVEVGGFLVEQERLRLARMLRAALRRPVVEPAICSKSNSAEQCRGLQHGA